MAATTTPSHTKAQAHTLRTQGHPASGMLCPVCVHCKSDRNNMHLGPHPPSCAHLRCSPICSLCDTPPGVETPPSLLSSCSAPCQPQTALQAPAPACRGRRPRPRAANARSRASLLAAGAPLAATRPQPACQTYSPTPCRPPWLRRRPAGNAGPLPFPALPPLPGSFPRPSCARPMCA